MSPALGKVRSWFRRGGLPASPKGFTPGLGSADPCLTPWPCRGPHTVRTGGQLQTGPQRATAPFLQQEGKGKPSETLPLPCLKEEMEKEALLLCPQSCRKEPEAEQWVPPRAVGAPAGHAVLPKRRIRLQGTISVPARQSEGFGVHPGAQPLLSVPSQPVCCRA